MRIRLLVVLFLMSNITMALAEGEAPPTPAPVTTSSKTGKDTKAAKSKKPAKIVKSNSENIDIDKKQRIEANEFEEQQNQEYRDFIKSLFGKGPQEKKDLTKEFRKQQDANEKEFAIKQDAERKEFTKAKLDKAIQEVQANTAINDAAKAAKIKAIQDKTAENEAFYARQRGEKKILVGKVGSDGKIPRNDKNTASTPGTEAKKVNESTPVVPTAAPPAAAPATPPPAINPAPVTTDAPKPK